MFLYQSNRLEALLARFLAIVAEAAEDPLSPEIVVVQNQGMGQWLQGRIAFDLGISAGLRLPLPGRFVWDLLHNLADDESSEDPFHQSILRWRIAALLPRYVNDPLFQELAAYLQNDGDGFKRYQLSGRISEVFDQYMIYRPDLLAAWTKGTVDQLPKEERWQARLWQALSGAKLPQRASLASEIEGFLHTLPKEELRRKLPHRIHLFGIGSLAPQYLKLIKLLSRHIQVHLFHLSPCRHYWADLISLRQRMKIQETQDHPEDLHYELGHPLLMSLGKTAQDFFRQLMDYDALDHDLYVESEERHLLARVQNDLLELMDRSAPDAERHLLQEDDFSIRFHIAFSPLREIQTLHDRLLDLFQLIPDLEPGDILVCAPDIQRYAAAIAGVFGQSGGSPRLPWSMPDQAPERRHPLIRCFLDLLELLGKRFTAPELLALCETAALTRRFDLDAAFVPRLYEWVEESGIRWGLDDEHCREMGSKASSRHTWRFGLDRLLLAHLMGPTAEPYAGRRPASRLLSGESGQLGAFCALIDRLEHWRRFFSVERDALAWQEGLLTLLDELFAPEGDESLGLELIRRAISDLGSHCREAAYFDAISPLVIKTRLNEVLTKVDSGRVFLSGKVHFCNMVPMRSVPFRVICLLGMNHQDFPRAQHPPAFDLGAAHPRLGDRDRRADDCGLFLEAILSARDALYISWVGRSQHDDSVLPPSVLVSELRDYLNQSCTPPEGQNKAAEALTTLHPMQPFSPRAYDGSPATASYDPAWIPAADTRPPPLFLPEPLKPITESQSVSLERLLCFWRHPVRFFLEYCLELRTWEDNLPAKASEPFTLDGAQAFQLRQETVRSLLAGQCPNTVQERLAAGGALPQGVFGELCFAQLSAHCAHYARVLRPLLDDAMPPRPVDQRIGPYQLIGQLGQLGARGRVSWRSAAVKGSDLMEVWICHLVFCLTQAAKAPLPSIYVAPDGSQEPPLTRVFAPLSPDRAEELLLPIIEHFQQGLSQALPFFPRTSLAWAREMRAEAKNEDQAMRAARACWLGNEHLSGEGEQTAYRYFYADRDPLDADFAAISAILLPLLSRMEISPT